MQISYKSQKGLSGERQLVILLEQQCSKWLINYYCNTKYKAHNRTSCTSARPLFSYHELFGLLIVFTDMLCHEMNSQYTTNSITHHKDHSAGTCAQQCCPIKCHHLSR